MTVAFILVCQTSAVSLTQNQPTKILGISLEFFILFSKSPCYFLLSVKTVQYIARKGQLLLS